ncbi:MAG: carbon-nitrogen hydrolase family protein [Acidobacteriota bacterium]
MKVTVCELPNHDPRGFESAWKALAEHVEAEGSDFVLLPEMPFSAWLAADEVRDAGRWRASVDAHRGWRARLHELGAPSVALTEPVLEGGTAFNEAQLWARGAGAPRPSHRKYYLPEEGGFWEARWYRRGDGRFDARDIPGARVGFLICTEMWFTRHARDYGRDGVQLLLTPRATLAPSVDKWIAGGRAAAVVSGAYSLSSNFTGDAGGELGAWGGAGWIIEPEEGEVLGVTSAQEPFLTLDIDLGVADLAKSTYPRYVED